MQLVAYLNGERIDATEMAHDPWRALVHHPLYETLALQECGLRASRVTRRGRQFFKHYPDVECPVNHKSESEQHLVMKRALKDRINATPGWHAEVELAHPDRAWIADVMAFHTSGRKLAFEVQLSAQSEEEYVFRSQRYLDDGIAPVWIVPESLDWFRVRLPMIVTGFGKSSDLPEEPAALMQAAKYQPVVRNVERVGLVVDRILHPSFRWAPGTPKQQTEALAREEKNRLKNAAAAQLQATAAAAAKLAADQEAVRKNAERDALFLERAAPPDVSETPAAAAAMNIWASVVHCVGAGHPMLIWRLVEPPARIDLRPYRPGPENFQHVRAHVAAWLEAHNRGLVEAKIVPLHGTERRQGFSCPECKEVIQGRWVASLPHTKWSLIAAGTPSRSGRTLPPWEVLRRKQAEQLPAGRQKLPAAHHQRTYQEAEPVISPNGKPFWMSEARNAEEIAERQAAKDARAARMQAIRDNPRYRGSPNGFRFQCSDCGGMFEDDNEGIHADGGCLNPGVRGAGWR
ncbi:competence protein CoiA [Arthrobacter sp. NPDC056727]|uniref:competence protein CoiA n=1 Tax=Arthrobacter sp. NPDC056727 TaxID=3345927 RepID=UPI00366D6DD5